MVVGGERSERGGNGEGARDGRGFKVRRAHPAPDAVEGWRIRPRGAVVGGAQRARGGRGGKEGMAPNKANFKTRAARGEQGWWSGARNARVEAKGGIGRLARKGRGKARNVGAERADLRAEVRALYAVAARAAVKDAANKANFKTRAARGEQGWWSGARNARVEAKTAAQQRGQRGDRGRQPLIAAVPSPQAAAAERPPCPFRANDDVSEANGISARKGKGRARGGMYSADCKRIG